jgi:hypothetical protein
MIIDHSFDTEAAAADYVWDRAASHFINLWITGTFDVMYFRLQTVSVRCRDEAAKDLALDGDTARLRSLSYHSDAGIRNIVALREDCSPRILRRLAKDLENAATVAHNPLTPPKVLARLAGHFLPAVSSAVASNPGTPDEALRQLASANDPASLAMFVARNPSCPADVLEQLATHPLAAVRWQVAGNRSTPRHVLEALAEQSDFGIRWHLAARHELAPETLLTWAREDIHVARIIARTPTKWNEVLDSLAIEFRDDVLLGNLATNAATNYSTRLKIASEANSSVARHILLEKSPPTGLLDALIAGQHNWLGDVLALARKPNYDVSISVEAHAKLEALGDEDSRELASAARVRDLSKFRIRKLIS